MQDPHQSLEDLAAPATQQFIAQEHAATLDRFCQSSEYAALRDAILAQLQDERQIPFCQEHRARMYHFHQSPEYPKGVYRVCTAASYRAGLPEWQTLFSVADFDEILGDDVYLDGVSHYVEQPEIALLTLSPSGSDAAYTVEFNLATHQIVPNGFHFPLGKNHIAWRDENSVWVCPAWDERQLTPSGYPREVWLMQRGQTFDQAQAVFRQPENGVMVHAWRYLDPQGAPIDLIESATSFFQKTYYQVSKTGEPQPLALPRDADIVGYIAGQLVVQLKSAWHRANQSYPAGSLIAVKLNKGVLGAAQCLITPNAQQAIESVETTRRYIIANLLDNVSGSLKAWQWQNGAWHEAALPSLPNGAIDLTDQPWGGDVLYLAASDFTTPLTLYALDLSVMELSVMRRQVAQFNAEGIIVEQHHAPSADGTPIPYYWVGKQPRQPETPTLVYVYGGFNVPELPHYMGVIGKHWLEQGNAFVLANIRGGGEFTGWHEAAQRQHKHKSVDDLLAVVQHLCQQGYSRAERIAIQGGSNGGLIVASAYTRQPENIGAMVCEVPLTDMLRYPQLYAGASWIEEYGDPADPPMRDYLAAFSPYHNVSGSLKYPPALITTSLADDRVHPAHALKFHAQLRAHHAPSHLYAPASGGHTGNGTQQETAEELACVLRFLAETVGEGG